MEDERYQTSPAFIRPFVCFFDVALGEELQYIRGSEGEKMKSDASVEHLCLSLLTFLK